MINKMGEEEANERIRKLEKRNSVLEHEIDVWSEKVGYARAAALDWRNKYKKVMDSLHSIYAEELE